MLSTRCNDWNAHGICWEAGDPFGIWNKENLEGPVWNDEPAVSIMAYDRCYES